MLRQAALTLLKSHTLQGFQTNSHVLYQHGIAALLPRAKSWGCSHLHSFTALGISEELNSAVASQGITTPSAIQAAAIPHIMSGRNCGLQSWTGSGKTLAYLLPALQRAGQQRQPPNSTQEIQVVIAAPSHELCMQIVRTAANMLPQSQRHVVQQVIGGANKTRQQQALRHSKPWVVVGTPGRLLDLIEDGSLHVAYAPLLILDEVDQLSSKFKDDTEHIARAVGRKLSSPRQTVVVSASLSKQLLQGLGSWCPKAAYISAQQALSSLHGEPGPTIYDQKRVPGDSASPAATAAAAAAATASTSASAASAAAGASTSAAQVPAAAGTTGWTHETPNAAAGPNQNAAGDSPVGTHQPEDPSYLRTKSSKARKILPPHLQHFYVVSSSQLDLAKLASCMNALSVQQALVFVNKVSLINQMGAVLENHRMRSQVTIMHGKLSKLERTNIIDAFRRGVFRALITSDIACRGMDFSGLDTVFNIGLPVDEVVYAHRAGRTGRLGGPPGRVVSIVSRLEVPKVELMAIRLGVQVQAVTPVYGKFVPVSATEPQG